MNTIISEYVIIDKIPFFLLNIANYKIPYPITKKYKNVNKLINDNFDTVINDTINNNNNKYSISIYENYNNLIPMSKYLENELSNNEITNLLFQVLFSYSYLFSKLINFRHNNFTIDSFFVEQLSEKNTYELTIGDINFILNTNTICKLYNYRLSEMNEFKNIYPCQSNNSSYDIYYFFKSIYDFSYKTKKNL